MSIRRLALVAVFVALSMAMRQGAPAPFQMTTVVGRTAVKPGERVPLAVTIAIPAGLHIQSNKPHDPDSIPAVVKITGPSNVTATGFVFPPSKDFLLAGSTDPLAVFEGDVLVGVQVEIGKDAKPGPLTITGQVQYQACNDTTCFSPRKVDVSWETKVTSGSAQTTAAHPDVFKGIDFTQAEMPSAGARSAAAAPPAPTSAVASGDVLKLFDQFSIVATNTDGYSGASEFVTFIKNAEAGVKTKGPLEGRGPLAVLAIVFLGGLALNLTPCVLPMVPINLAIIGAGAQSKKRGRGLLLGGAYGAAMALVYGVLGVVVILTAGTFGTINASPWFNIGIAVLFVALALAMFDVISIDFSRYSSSIKFTPESRGTVALASGMGAVAALLAGACVAPVVIQVVVFASNLYATGVSSALALPFVLGLGMALPWPIAGAGLASLPRPGAWMVRVKQAMGVFILATAAYYAYQAYEIFDSRSVDPSAVQASVDEQIKDGWHASLAEGLQTAQHAGTPVLVDFWATWCKNCWTMDRTTLKDPAVTGALAGYTLVKFQAEDPSASPAKELMQRIGAVGLPAYVILKPKTAAR